METRRMSNSLWVLWIVLASNLVPAKLQVTIQATIGEDVLLPCVCPPAPTSSPAKYYLVWQIGDVIVVDHAISDTEDKTNVDLQYQGRTHLFYPKDKDNCSLLLHRVCVEDERTYSCIFSEPELTNVTVKLEVVANYSPHVQCSTDGVEYKCQARGGYPKGRVYWLWEDQQGSQSEVCSQDHACVHGQDIMDHHTGLYNLTSTLKTNTTVTAVQCVVENPRSKHNITAPCPNEAPVFAPVGMEVKTSLAVGSVFLLLACIFLVVLIKIWKPCPSSEILPPAQYDSVQSLKM
ncbi:hypothetical protein AGOR_G00217500 [Albula goreensis]|uniref:Ig-like domain-containing protein n=1 Tax=Albula goreensis TaxID=1534307 RepID=A0A8T3CMQ7_9TELE|nr:hypothetical protein AGOR_G00217500 [Albula goreensis]